MRSAPAKRWPGLQGLGSCIIAKSLTDWDHQQETTCVPRKLCQPTMLAIGLLAVNPMISSAKNEKKFPGIISDCPALQHSMSDSPVCDSSGFAEA
jgi:hypothetical protein